MHIKSLKILLIITKIFFKSFRNKSLNVSGDIRTYNNINTTVFEVFTFIALTDSSISIRTIRQE